MPAPRPRRHRLRLTLLSTPAALTAILWLASHLWITWYVSAPTAPALPGTAIAPSIRTMIHAGALHTTDDETIRRAAQPLPPGTPILGTMTNANGTITRGLRIHWSPTLPTAATWRLDMLPGNWRIPLYIPLVIFTAIPFAYFTITRTTIPGHCPKCNYNRKGLPLLAKCPECGTTPAST